MKKLKTCVCFVLSLFFMCFFTGCKEVAKKDDEFARSTKEIYQLYTTYATNEGMQPLTYEQWLASIKGADGKDGVDGKDGADGKDGVGIVNAFINNKYELILVLDTGELNCGKIIFEEEKTVQKLLTKTQQAQKILKKITDEIVELAGEKNILSITGATRLFLNNSLEIRKYFDLKEDIIDIQAELNTHEYYEQINTVVEECEKLEQTFADNAEKYVNEFFADFNEKNNLLTQAINNLILLLF